MQSNFSRMLPRTLLSTTIVCLVVALFPPAANASPRPRRILSQGHEGVYFPGRRENWERKSPDEVGMDPALLSEAIAFAQASESENNRDLAMDLALGMLMREPYAQIVGPTKQRGGLNGIVLRHGYLVAEWGKTKRVDMTFSVSKTFLSTVVGLAWDRGLIGDVQDLVKDYMPTDHFNSPHNSKISWNHLLRQTSDWSGTLWDKPDWADRPQGRDRSKWPHRELHEPGSYWKYNDVRVNLLALAALHVWRKPLPQVLREEVMDPIGASNTWRWHGYRNSWVEIDGQRMQSVSGGGHWGGGMFIRARDMARFGYLFLRDGRWKDHQIISKDWIKMARTPTKANPTYGFMNWFLNTGKKGRVSSAPETAVVFLGSGTNAIYIDWENDLVVVVRWIQGSKLNPFIEKVLAALRQ